MSNTLVVMKSLFYAGRNKIIFLNKTSNQKNTQTIIIVPDNFQSDSRITHFQQIISRCSQAVIETINSYVNVFEAYPCVGVPRKDVFLVADLLPNQTNRIVTVLTGGNRCDTPCHYDVFSLCLYS